LFTKTLDISSLLGTSSEEKWQVAVFRNVSAPWGGILELRWCLTFQVKAQVVAVGKLGYCLFLISFDIYYILLR
jgi:hypothetical protein